jgi:hypothetical protein
MLRSPNRGVKEANDVVGHDAIGLCVGGALRQSSDTFPKLSNSPGFRRPTWTAVLRVGGVRELLQGEHTGAETGCLRAELFEFLLGLCGLGLELRGSLLKPGDGLALGLGGGDPARLSETLDGGGGLLCLGGACGECSNGGGRLGDGRLDRGEPVSGRGDGGASVGETGAGDTRRVEFLVGLLRVWAGKRHGVGVGEGGRRGEMGRVDRPGKGPNGGGKIGVDDG